MELCELLESLLVAALSFSESGNPRVVEKFRLISTFQNILRSFLTVASCISTPFDGGGTVFTEDECWFHY